MSINIEQLSYLSKLAALIYLYVELSLPLPAALRAAEADLGGWHGKLRDKKIFGSVSITSWIEEYGGLTGAFVRSSQR
jgi:hypothetical protein